ncbi:family 20 glycosylhydrolase [Mangrovibacterium sp.]|uniref:family 20 glycosylhydrolase n=1 Tax=Mangrovibacterium sp. TaxID=1961364 RepID=UPI003563EB62
MGKFMNFTLAAIPIVAVLLLASCANPSFKPEDISLVPQPESLVVGESSFRFDAHTRMVVNDEAPAKAASYLNQLFETAAGFSLVVTDKASKNAVVFQQTEGMAPEAYKLEITTGQIVIQAADEAGFFYGVQTIRQLLPHQIESAARTDAQWVVPCVEVNDKPRFSWRGMHMDFSRHFFNIDEVKDFLDYMALYKLNMFHMHLTDDQGWRIEIKKYPLLTEKGAWRIENNQDTICNERAVENELYTIDPSNYREIDGQRKYGGFFTQDQIREIVAYADERCITVVPEIDMPGHFLAAIDNYLFLSCTGEPGWGRVFSTPACLGKETTYEFMENILDEVADLFPCEYIHIGGDEVRIEIWEECPNCQNEIKTNNLKDEHELQSHFNRRIERFLQSKGKQLMGWDEIVEGGLTADASVMWWRGWRPEAPKIAAENGNDIVITTTAAYYYDYLNDHNAMHRVYEYEPVPADFTEQETAHVLGIQANLWTEWIPSFKRLQYQAFPRLQAMAETAWTNKELKDVEDFDRRMVQQFDRMDQLGIYYYIPAVEGLSKEIVYVDSTLVTLNLAYPLAGTEIYYTLDGSVPTQESIRYTEPFFVSDEGQIKARSFRGDLFNDIATAQIEHQDYREASSVVPATNGLKRWVAKAGFSKVEEIKLPASHEWAAVDSIGLGEFNEQADFAMVFSAYINIETDGIYEFELKSDGGSLLYLGDELVVDKSDQHGPFKKYEKVALKQGWHSFAVHYLASSKPREISVYVTQPDGTRELLTNAICSYE